MRKEVNVIFRGSPNISDLISATEKVLSDKYQAEVKAKAKKGDDKP